MVLGLRTKTLKTPCLHLDYVLHIDEVKPWPPSQSLRTLRAVLIQWQQVERDSGFTNQVVPEDGRIVFNQSFGLKLTLIREVGGDTYQSKCIEFNLYEPPGRNKGLKGQLLGNAVLELGAVKENMSISTPIQCKRTYRNSVQPLLFLRIQPVGESSLTREASMGGESVSALMNEEYAEEAEIASFTTDDDVSSRSSLPLTAATSPYGNKKNVTVAVNGSGRGSKVGREPQQPDEEQATESSSMDLSSDIAWISKRIKSHSLQSYVVKETEKRQSSSIIINEYQMEEEGFEASVGTGKSDGKSQSTAELSMSTLSKASRSEIDHKKNKHMLVAERTYSPQNGCMDNETREDHNTYVEEGVQEFENVMRDRYPQVDMQKQMALKNGTSSSIKESVRALSSSNIRKHSLVTDTSQGLNAKAFRKETRNLGRVQQLEHRVKILEGELREAAGLEVGIYSVVAEHGSSMNKVHAPARCLSRLYLNANKHNPKSGRASASKSVVSGLVLIAKACGNDIPRLTFWLSNTIVLRAIISKSSGESRIRGKAGEENGKKKLSPLTWNSVGDKEEPVAFVAALEKAEAWIFSRIIESLWWQSFTPHMQTGAAKAIRTNIDCNSSKSYRRKTSSWSAEQQGNFSMELWKKALMDACKRICPVRGGGHGNDCGCLPMLSKMIMEQLVARLDVAMLNAILRESADEIPTDPVADPISDASVLPIPAGKLNFGAGAQLKNVIGNWSRWVSDLFGMDEDKNRNSSSKSTFFLLNALSDLMMLPKDMLFTPSIRKEVCPAFTLPLLIRILNSFVPDEFCPDPVPGALLQALITELDLEEQDSTVNLLPSEAAAVVYKAPSVAAIFGGSSPLLNKSQTSNDELDQLRGNPTSVRFQLLRQLWNQD